MAEQGYSQTYKSCRLIPGRQLSADARLCTSHTRCQHSVWQQKVYEYEAFGSVIGRHFHCRLIFIHRGNWKNCLPPTEIMMTAISSIIQCRKEGKFLITKSYNDESGSLFFTGRFFRLLSTNILTKPLTENRKGSFV